jgi:hypothetical protein
MEFMATNGGPHPPRQWALITAGQIIQIAATAQGAQADAARDLQARLVDVLESFFNVAQENERAALAEHGDRLLEQPLDPTGYLDAAVGAVVDAIDPQFRDHFAQPHVRDYLRILLGQHFATSMNIERQWHAARSR